MSTIAATVLQMAFALLLSVQNNTTATDADRLQAITVANQAIQLATSVLGTGESASPVTPAAPVAAPASGIVSITYAPAPLSAAPNPVFSSPPVAPSTNNIHISSYVISAASSSAVTISSFSIRTSLNANSLQNLVVKLDDGQFGSTQSNVGSAITYTFTAATPVTIPAGSSKILNIFANVLLGAEGTMDPATTLMSCSGATVASTSVPVVCPQVYGQRITFKPTYPTLSASLSGTLSNSSVLPGTPAVRIGSYNLLASSLGGVKVTDLTVQTGTSTVGIQNMLVKVNGAQVSSAQLFVSPNSYYSFSLTTPILIAANGSQVVDIYADVSSSATGTMKNITTLADCSGQMTNITAPIACSPMPVLGQTLSIIPATGTFSSALNTGLGDQTQHASSTVTGARIGSYSLNVSAASSVNLTSVSIKTGPGAGYLQNLTVKADGVQMSLVQGTITSNTIYTFTWPVVISANSVKSIDVYADIPPITPLGTIRPATTLTGCTGKVTANNNDISCSEIPGQALTIN